MSAILGKILTLLVRGAPAPGESLDGFVDSLLQELENCRPGLSDDVIERGGEEAERFFLDLYDKEIPRLLDTIRLQEPHLTPQAYEEFVRKVDDLIRKVVLPAYLRLALRFTPRERNDFYLAPEPFHGLERLGWSVVGMALGAFALWAPFIPIWSKEWVLPFAVAGLFLPNLRRIIALRRYESELNQIVVRADREIARIDLAYLTSGEALSARVLGGKQASLFPKTVLSKAEGSETPTTDTLHNPEKSARDKDKEESRVKRRRERPKKGESNGSDCG